MTSTKSRNQLAHELTEAIAYARAFHLRGDKDQRDQAIRSIEDKPGLSLSQIAAATEKVFTG
jgi:hypothetical protein